MISGKGALAPSLVNDTYLQGTDTLMAEPTPEFDAPETPELDTELETDDLTQSSRDRYRC